MLIPFLYSLFWVQFTGNKQTHCQHWPSTQTHLCKVGHGYVQCFEILYHQKGKSTQKNVSSFCTLWAIQIVDLVIILGKLGGSPPIELWNPFGRGEAEWLTFTDVPSMPCVATSLKPVGILSPLAPFRIFWVHRCMLWGLALVHHLFPALAKKDLY